MRGTNVPGLELPVSQLALGTMTFGDTASEEVAGGMLAAALDAGITVVDTANGYAGGASEEILAKFLLAHRDAIILATKAGIPHPDAGDNPPLSGEGLRRSVEGSLRRLATDRIELFYLHQPDREAPLEETLDAVGQLIREGRIPAWGVSNYAAWQISELNTAADAADMPRPVVAQQLYNLLATRIEDEYLEFAQHTGLLTMVYNPLDGGLLTGRHSFTEPPTEGRFGNSRVAEMYKQRYGSRGCSKPSASSLASRTARACPCRNCPSAGCWVSAGLGPSCWADPGSTSCRTTLPPQPRGRSRARCRPPVMLWLRKRADRCQSTTARHPVRQQLGGRPRDRRRPPPSGGGRRRRWSRQSGTKFPA